MLFARLSAVEETFAPLPRLNPRKEQPGSDEHNAPFPTNAFVFEDLGIDDRDIEHGKERHKTEHNSPEKELVAPDIVCPLRKVLLRVGLHAEQGSSLINHLPSQEEGKPR